MVMKPTSPTPIISAEALDAVRLGLRMAFSRASAPAVPRRRGSGAPSALLNGSDTVRPRADTPKNTSSTPRPTTARALAGLVNSPYSIDATPPTTTSDPTMTRCLDP
jgi:hypothetical protein